MRERMSICHMAPEGAQEHMMPWLRSRPCWCYLQPRRRSPPPLLLVRPCLFFSFVRGHPFLSPPVLRPASPSPAPAAPLSLPPPPSADDSLSILEERANALMACMPVGALEVAGASEDAEDLTDENAELLHLKAVSHRML